MFAIRSRFTNAEQARRFGAFLKDANIITRGFVKVGLTSRGLRGLIATKLIPVNETVIVVPHKAFITVFDAVRDTDFVREVCNGAVPLSIDHVSERVGGGSFLFVHQILLGFYMADILLSGSEAPPGFCRYVDYLPRAEGNFVEFDRLLQTTMPKWHAHEVLLRNFCKKHHLNEEDGFTAVRWAVMMVISRGLPIEHTPTLDRILESTEFAKLLVNEPKESQYSIPVMCPLLDMVNHSPANDNIAVMVPDHDMKDTRPIVARALRNIPAGEEITMRYGICDPYGMRVFYGIEQILP